MSKTNETDESVSARKVALQVLLAVLKEGQSLSALHHMSENLEHRESAFARLLSFGVLRYYQQLQGLLKPLMKKPLKAKDFDIQLTLLIGLYQIMHTRVPDYAVVDAAVKQVRKSRKQWAANMVNGVLRNFIRQQAALIDGLQDEEAQFAHPQWIIDRLKHDWPENWQAILEENLAQAPMTLRINQRRTTVDEYLAELEKEYELRAEKMAGIPSALILEEARDVKQLPGFHQGWFSVQDGGAQLAAQILQPATGDRILDACAAPGGKTAHLHELQAEIKLTALDVSKTRLKRVEENSQRLGFSPELIVADATDVDSWWQGEAFDKILLDVPCSATGVIRRHPDIKQLRREEDIQALVALQRDILLKNWSLLKPGGRLLYATCSLFKAENQQQIEWFLKQAANAELVDINSFVKLKLHSEAISQEGTGLQLFPALHRTDGFYYALLEKSMG
ncbi:16S rRNA (cytosine(967)-C(5))-methyltransferase [hydrothermal vent metagenome]|uniref:16S rRNA (cytosine(967)-C(5))-methyltransferase n=1 Tax=hydrothermal vent metagenome TaxID=652676 RepID=A0A3B0XY63_9ZZZZ